MDVRSLTAAFFETFDGSARADLARFMGRFPLTRTWLISGDYVVSAKGRPNDVFAFSIIPYAQELSVLRERLASGLPRDIKGTRAFTAAAGDILRGPDVFHVPVVLPRNRLLLGPTGALSVANGRQAAADLVRDAIAMERGDEMVKAMQRVERATTGVPRGSPSVSRSPARSQALLSSSRPPSTLCSASTECGGMRKREISSSGRAADGG